MAHPKMKIKKRKSANEVSKTDTRDYGKGAKLFAIEGIIFLVGFLAYLIYLSFAK
jgi:hypothetical protein